MNIDKLVNLVIDVRDRVVSGPSLSTPLLLGYHTAWLDRLVGEYSSPAEMLDDGFTVDDYLYKQATTLKSQVGAPPTFKIGRRTTPLTQTIRITPTNTTEGFVHRGTIAGESYEVTNGASASVATVVAALQAAIDAFDGVSASDDTTHLTVTAPEGDWVDVNVGAGSDVMDMTADTTTGDDLAAIEAEDADWYGLLPEVGSAAGILQAAAWTEARRKICIVQSPNADILDPNEDTDIASQMLSAGYTRTFGIYHRPFGGTEWLATGWMAPRLTATPGSETWAFKPVAGVSTDKLSTAQENAVETKNWNHYTRTAGQNMTYDGKSGAGRYGDIVTFIDWTYNEIQLAILGWLLNNPKVPYTNAGGDALQSVVQAVLNRGLANGGWSPDPAPVAIVPRVENISSVLKAARTYPFSFQATLAGAVHKVTGTGVAALP
jgi:hypothetical protein